MIKMVIKNILLGAVTLSAATSLSAAPTVYVADENGNLATVDVTTGTATLIGNSGIVLTDIAFDNNGQLYGISFDELYRVDRTTAALTAIGATGAAVNALTFGANGTLYAAGGNQLFTLNTSTGLATDIGTTGFTSSGDLTFYNGDLYLSAFGPSLTDALVKLALPGATGTLVGSLGLSEVYGLSRAENNVIYANSNQNIYAVNAATGSTTLVSSYTYAGAGLANGTTFLNEASAAVPESATWAMFISGFGLVGGALRQRRVSVSLV